jgi:hypothetical protein
MKAGRALAEGEPGFFMGRTNQLNYQGYYYLQLQPPGESFHHYASYSQGLDG